MSLELLDEFQDDKGETMPEMPSTHMRVQLVPGDDDGTTMTLTSTFASRESMDQLMDMGMEEGIKQAMSQVHDVLAS